MEEAQESKKEYEEKTRLTNESQQLLSRLLMRLELISPSLLQEGLGLATHFPIAHYAARGFYEEWSAIKKIAEHLKISAIHMNSTSQKELVKLLLKEPFSKIDSQLWKSSRLIPFEISNDSIKIAMANPLDHEIVSSLEFQLGKKIEVVIGAESEILAVATALADVDDSDRLEVILKSSKPLELINVSEKTRELESNISKDDPNAAPVIRLVNKIFANAIKKGASDIHITPQKNSLMVRIRIDGVMHTLHKVPDSFTKGAISRIKLLCGMDIAERRKPQDGRLRLKMKRGHKDLRISTVPSAYGENIVARILASDLQKIGLDSLAMSPELQRKFERSLQSSSKVNLVTGPTGSGKTTTLYSGLLHLRDGSTNIITLEDPIEYRVSGTTQIQVNAKTGITFAEGLRSVLRQDPDVILVGEIRDSETASIALQVAQTGHLVLSTLHTNSALAAITRLRDLDIPAFAVASGVGSILAQRLVRKLCPACAVPVEGKIKERIENLGISADKSFQAKGCDECSDTGYQGRVGVYSFIEINDEIAEAIRQEESEVEIAKLARKNGFQTLREAALDLIDQGITSLCEVELVIGPMDQENDGLIEKSSEKDLKEGIPKRKLLLVEDDEDTAAILKLLFQNEMFDVTTAQNGKQALEMIYKSPPEVIVSDLMMPGMDGHEFLSRLQAEKRTKEIPVLMLTANSTDESELALIKSGASDFVSKSDQTEILLARLRRLVGN